MYSSVTLMRILSVSNTQKKKLPCLRQLINQSRELLGIKSGVSKVAAERRKSVVGTQNKTAVPGTRDKTSWSGSSLTGADKNLWDFALGCVSL